MRVAFVIWLWLGMWGDAHGQGYGFTVPALPVTSIDVDGRLEDWPSGLTDVPLRCVLQGYRQYDPSAPDTSDLQATFRVAYSHETSLLYVAVKVYDDEVRTAYGVQKTDVCEIYLSATHGAPPAQQYLMFPGDGRYDPEEPANPVINRGGDISSTRSRGAWRTVGDTTVYEWALEVFERLPDRPLSLQAGLKFGLDVVVVDRDSGLGKPHWVSWTPGGRKFFKPLLMGEVELLSSADGLASFGRIPGRVVQRNSGLAWTGAVVSAISPEGRAVGAGVTDAAGSFELWLPAGQYTIRLPDAAEPEETTAVVRPGVTGEPVRLELDRVGGAGFPVWPAAVVLSLFSGLVVAGLWMLWRQRGRLGLAMFRPALAFRLISADPKWEGPLGIILLSVGLASIGTAGLVDATLLGATLTMTGALSDAARLTLPLFAMVGFLLLGFGAWFVRGIMLWALAHLSGGRGSFFGFLSSVGYAAAPRALAVGVAAALVAWGLQQEVPWTLSLTSVASLPQYLDFGSVAGEIELFAIWSLGLSAVAASRSFDVGRLKSVLLVMGYFGIHLASLALFWHVLSIASQRLSDSL